MPHSCQSSRKAILLAIVILFAPSLVAQKAPPPSQPKYDLSTESKVKGVVMEVRLPPKGSEIAHLLVKIGMDSFDVYLCPRSFLDDMGVSFAQGDEIVLTGSKVRQADADLILAREILKGNDTLVLRDEKGKPVWS